MSNGTKRTLTGVTLGLWGVSIFAVTPWGSVIASDVARLLLGVAIVFTMSHTVRRCLRPADEVYLAGKEIGRREAMLEIESARVVRIRDARTLRVVGERSRD